MALQSLTVSDGDYYLKQKAFLDSDEGQTELKVQVLALEKGFGNLQEKEVEAIFSNLSDIPEASEDVERLKRTALRRMNGAEEVDWSLSDEEILEQFDHQIEEGVEPETLLMQILDRIEGGTTGYINLYQKAIDHFGLRERSETLMMRENSLIIENKSDTLFDKESQLEAYAGFQPPAPEEGFEDEIELIDEAIFEGGDLDRAMAPLLKDWEVKIEDPQFIQAYLHMRFLIVNNGKELPRFASACEEEVLRRIDGATEYNALMAVREKESG